jgi:hypothetical protein
MDRKAANKTVSAEFLNDLLDRAAVDAREIALRIVNDPFDAEDIVDRAILEIAHMSPDEVGDLGHAETLLRELVQELCLRCIDGVPANDNGEADDDEDENDHDEGNLDFDP